MSKGIELTPSQIKALENNATLFMFPVTNIREDFILDTFTFKKLYINLFIEEHLPIQKGDKDIQIRYAYEIALDDNEIASMGCAYNGEETQITYDVVGMFSECIDVRVVRVQDIRYDSIVKIIGEEKTQWNSKQIMDQVKFFNSYNKQMQEQGFNRTYEDNDYVFLVEFEK